MNFTHIVLFQTCKDTKFVSNSQRTQTQPKSFRHCFRRAKIQNLSAIHNLPTKYPSVEDIVSDVQRYKICQQFTTSFNNTFCTTILFQTCKDTKFVSNSQLIIKNLPHQKNCFRRAKIQNLSAIHNSFDYLDSKSFIVSDVQRYKICQQFTTR